MFFVQQNAIIQRMFLIPSL